MRRLASYKLKCSLRIIFLNQHTTLLPIRVSQYLYLPPLYLFSEVFGCPGFVISCPLLLLPPLTLLQLVFVLCGFVDVPFSERLGHILP